MKTATLPSYVLRRLHHRPWSREEVAKLKRLFPDYSNVAVARELGRGIAGVARIARNLKLRKSAEYLAAMGRKNIRARWN